MTKEQAIKEVNKAFEPAFANYIITALTEGATVSDKALEQQPSDDCVSREAVLDTLMKYEKPCDDRQDFYLDSTTEFEEEIKELPPVTPTHGTCKDCKYWHDDGIMTTCDKNIGNGFPQDYYCAGFEKRGNEE